MTEQPIDKRERYVGYATCCLQMAKTVLDGQTRTTLREMASEWLKLAEHAYDWTFSIKFKFEHEYARDPGMLVDFDAFPSGSDGSIPSNPRQCLS
jgi:hypothetical protein